MLDNGKIDFRRILTLASESKSQGTEPKSHAEPAPQQVLSLLFLKRIASETAKILGFAEDEWASVESIYRTLVTTGPVSGESTFMNLNGDSLSFVQTHLALETYLGSVPDKWEGMPVNDLERLKSGAMAF